MQACIFSAINNRRERLSEKKQAFAWQKCLRVNVPWFFTKTGIFPLCSDNYLRWKIRSKKSIWIMQNDFLVNTQWSQGNSRTCSQDRGEKQEKKGKWKISVSLWFFGNIIDQMASPGHFMWKIRYPEGTWLEKDFFFAKTGPPRLI